MKCIAANIGANSNEQPALMMPLIVMDSCMAVQQLVASVAAARHGRGTPNAVEISLNITSQYTNNVSCSVQRWAQGSQAFTCGGAREACLKVSQRRCALAYTASTQRAHGPAQ